MMDAVDMCWETNSSREASGAEESATARSMEGNDELIPCYPRSLRPMTASHRSAKKSRVAG